MSLKALILFSIALLPALSFADFSGKAGQFLDDKGGRIYDVDSIDYTLPGRIVLNLSSGGTPTNPVTLVVNSNKVQAAKSLIDSLGWIGCKNASPGQSCAISDAYVSNGFGINSTAIPLKDL